MAHSPPPWLHEAFSDSILDANDEPVAVPPDGYDEERWQKDAPVIAAAPGLLVLVSDCAALLRGLQFEGRNLEFREAIERRIAECDAAIAKATT